VKNSWGGRLRKKVDVRCREERNSRTEECTQADLGGLVVMEKGCW
jgi:hypothetical protein